MYKSCSGISTGIFVTVLSFAGGCSCDSGGSVESALLGLL